MAVQMKTTYGDKEFAGKIVSIKQLTKYADITTAFPDYNPEDAVYEVKVVPNDNTATKGLLVNSSVVLQ